MMVQRDMFSSPRRRRNKKGASTREFVIDAKNKSKKESAELNLAFRETRRLPDVAGHERLKWAAGVLRIDLTETGIRT